MKNYEIYNEELKDRFIRSYTANLERATVAKGVFMVTAEKEMVWDMDVCAASVDMLEELVPKLKLRRAYRQSEACTILRAYIKWCYVQGVEGATLEGLGVFDKLLESLKKEFVSSPYELQNWMDAVFDPEENNTVDLIMRGFYWLIYAGLRPSEAISVRREDIDLVSMRVMCDGQPVALYPESFYSLDKILNLSEFNYFHPLYGKRVRPRLPEGTIFRGFKNEFTESNIRQQTLKLIKAALAQKKTEKHVTPHSTWLSGFYYRTYINEKRGVTPDFNEAIERMAKKEVYTDKLGPEVRLKAYQRQYLEEYLFWKMAYYD